MFLQSRSGDGYKTVCWKPSPRSAYSEDLSAGCLPGRNGFQFQRLSHLSAERHQRLFRPALRRTPDRRLCRSLGYTISLRPLRGWQKSRQLFQKKRRLYALPTSRGKSNDFATIRTSPRRSLPLRFSASLSLHTSKVWSSTHRKKRLGVVSRKATCCTEPSLARISSSPPAASPSPIIMLSATCDPSGEVRELNTVPPFALQPTKKKIAAVNRQLRSILHP